MLLLQIWLNILSRHALLAGRLAALGARRHFHHGLLDKREGEPDRSEARDVVDGEGQHEKSARFQQDQPVRFHFEEKFAISSASSRTK